MKKIARLRLAGLPIIAVCSVLLFRSLTLASVFYDFDVVALTGQKDTQGQTITKIEPEVSINDRGFIAFRGHINNGDGIDRENIFVFDPASRNLTPLMNVSPVFELQSRTTAPGQTFSAPQINNNNKVIAQRQMNALVLVGIFPFGQTLDGPFTYLEIWSANNPGCPKGTNPNAPRCPNESEISCRPELVAMGDAALGARYALTTFLGPICGHVLPSPFVPFSPWAAVLAGKLNPPAINNNEESIFWGFDSSIKDFLATPTFPQGSVYDFNRRPVPVREPIGARIADDGTIVARVNAGQPKIVVMSYDLSTEREIAVESTTAQCSVLGGYPGISDSGQVVVFAGKCNFGSSTPIDGIFLSYKTSKTAPFTTPIRIAGFASSSIPELGYDASGTPLFLKSFALDSRIAVSHVELGTADLLDDSFVVSFLATPSAASRTNPRTGKPFTFSAAQGIWTVRVDVEKDLAGGRVLRLHQTSPIPVIQVGDVVRTGSGSFTIDSLVVHDQLANATTDDANVGRTPRRGDHRLAFWASSGANSFVVRGTHLDSDQDGLLDRWETEGIDADQDGTSDLNLAAMGADPKQRDLFIEMDWLKKKLILPKKIVLSFTPPRESIDFLVNMFAAAPGGGIKVHVDAGPGRSRNMGTGSLQGGDEIQASGNHIDVVYFHFKDALNNPILPVAPVTTFPGPPVKIGRSFDDIKNTFFGTTDKRAREFVFRYVVFADRNTDPTEDSSGVSEVAFRSDDDGIPGNDLVVSLQGQRTQPPLPVGFLQAQTLAHELGHTIGLRHGGVDQVTSSPPPSLKHNPGMYKPKYLSLMNYAHQFGLREFATTGTPNSLTAFGTPFTGIGGDALLTALPVLIQKGTGTGQTRTITSNTVTQLQVSPNWVTVPNNTSFFRVLRRDYSGASDPVFDDWGHIELDFSSYGHFLGNSFGLEAAGLTPGVMDPEQDVTELELDMGPFDKEAPTVTIVDPAPAASVPIGTNLTVRLIVEDDFGVDESLVGVAFDIDGDGTINGSSEVVPATKTGPNTFEAIFLNIAGPIGNRIVTASATDRSGAEGEATVSITIVGGSLLVKVPNVIGQTQANAQAVITAAGLVVGTVTTANSNTVPAGSVISQTPSAGANVATGTAVNLVISSGLALVTVPNVIGQTQANAQAAITGAGLVVGTVSTANSNTVPAGSVISQTPTGGAKVAPGSAVNLVVSSEPIVTPCATNVTSQVSVSRGGFRRNSATGRYVQQITLKNTGTTAIQGSVSLALDSLSSNATLFSSTGNTSCATPVSPYKNVNVGADNVLSPGESATVVLEFTNPTNAGITYNTRILAGPNTR